MGIGNGSTWTSSREPSGSITSILLPAQVDNTIEQQQHFDRADIVMITDGKCDVQREFLEQLKVKQQQREFSIYGVLIGGADERQMKQFCDRIWVVQDLVSDEVAIEELFLL
ncbi:MAG: hypothetical protein CLLPBCKN_001591 [Chroococcidiopsis cubana SAG 39.79]|uniref:VWFA domain-containing protein n=1 Tax=Chroococcidiopsis cubana SAG 39.79 TaxID=388085 RepID=A0AB37UDV4_9CYAN|nr:hypothetical protein [Chroococcidiopsis cubana]MDZ4872203.1 hypothetical protein [Chroococcidiopsis cubana SAG 39.79]RUT07973.1 hypothetical protein DSM107010_49230 [Chroococcidiopsis cubana SAG 39.79]